ICCRNGETERTSDLQRHAESGASGGYAPQGVSSLIILLNTAKAHQIPSERSKCRAERSWKAMTGYTHTCIPIRKILMTCKKMEEQLHGSYRWCRLTKRQTCGD